MEAKKFRAKWINLPPTIHRLQYFEVFIPRAKITLISFMQIVRFDLISYKTKSSDTNLPNIVKNWSQLGKGALKKGKV